MALIIGLIAAATRALDKDHHSNQPYDNRSGNNGQYYNNDPYYNNCNNQFYDGRNSLRSSYYENDIYMRPAGRRQCRRMERRMRRGERMADRIDMLAYRAGAMAERRGLMAPQNRSSEPREPAPYAPYGGQQQPRENIAMARPQNAPSDPYLQPPREAQRQQESRNRNVSRESLPMEQPPPSYDEVVAPTTKN